MVKLGFDGFLMNLHNLGMEIRNVEPVTVR
jgi:hypothetical protein